jgi:cytochrome P450
MIGTNASAVDSEQVIRQSHDLLSRLRDQPPARIRFADGDEGWLITRYDDVKLVSTDPRLSRDLDGIYRLTQAREAAAEASASDGTESDGGYRWLFRNVLYRDPPDHTRLRKLVNKAFTPRAIDRLRPRLAQVADELLDQMAGREAVDLLPSFAVPLPVTAISELLGIPAADRPDFWAWSHVLNGDAQDADRIGALRAAAEYLGALAERKRAEPGTDLLSHMVMASEDGDLLSRQELISMAAREGAALVQGAGLLTVAAGLAAPRPHAAQRARRPGASWYGNAHDPISGLIYASLVLAQLALARRFRRDPGWRPGAHGCWPAPPRPASSSSPTPRP